ncbi:MAG: DNA repair exonuclease [Chloroflexia bacterium]|nr:DNA repair exonuclease [Chloroflexia bacterium]
MTEAPANAADRPIRIAHFSDTHLGYRAMSKLDPVTGRNQRAVDIEVAFERVIEDVVARGVDVAIHSGDVFHHTRPTWHSLGHLIRQLRRLEAAGIRTLVISGNHDTPRLRMSGSAFSLLALVLPEVRFVAGYESEHVVWEEFNLHLDAIPHGALTNPDPALSQVVPGRRNLLVTHGLTPGVLVPGPSEPGEQELSPTLLDADFDYVALGHYHIATQPAANAWYSGSTERTGWGDRGATPGYNLVEIGTPGGPVKVEHIALPVRPMLDLKPIHGDGRPAEDIVERVMDQLRKLNEPEAMTHVELIDTPRPIRREVEAILRRESGAFVWSLSVVTPRSVLLPNPAEYDDHEMTDLRALFGEFVASRKGTPPYDDAFAQAFLERGDRALAEALEAGATPDEEGAR